MKVAIMIGGKAGSGKDTAADFIVQNFPNYKKTAFAKSLKDHVGAEYGISDKLLYTQEGKRRMLKVGDTEMTVRELLIIEAARKRIFNNDYWVEKTFEDLGELNLNERIVFSDFRYENEYMSVLEKFDAVFSLTISRKTHENIEDYSERALDNFGFDFKVQNNGNLETFYREIYNIVSDIERKLVVW
jgi:hypothetical protein